MIQLTLKLTAPASSGGGAGVLAYTVERVISLDRTVNTETELQQLVDTFKQLVGLQLTSLLDELVVAFKTTVTTAPATKKDVPDGQRG